MNRYRDVLGVSLLVGGLACGGAFSSPADGDGGSGTTTGDTTATATATATTTTTTTTNATATTTTTTNGTGGAGGSSTTGSGGSGGQLVDAHLDAPVACDTAAPLPVRFRMTHGPDSAFCVNICGSTWITILGPDGGAIVSTPGCVTTCSQCQPFACGGGASPPAPGGGGGACAPPQTLPLEGFTSTWDGALWQRGTCGAQQYACVNQVCGTPPGKYVARMCANRQTGSDAGPFCTGASTLTCVDVPFEYPTTAVVEGVLQ